MKTIITKENLVVGFGEASLDPEGSKPIVKNLLINSDEFSAISPVQIEIDRIIAQGKTYQEMAAKAAGAGDPVTAQKRKVEFDLAEAMRKEKEVELGGLFKALEKKKLDLMVSDGIYFEPKVGEYIVEKIKYDEIKTSSDGLTVNECLFFDGTTNSVKPDFRGSKVWEKTGAIWASNEILKVGVAPSTSEILDANLSDVEKSEIEVQVEGERVLNLSPEEKESELAAVTDSLLGEAAVMRSKLEIQGVALALEESQAWYQTEVDKALIKYS